MCRSEIYRPTDDSASAPQRSSGHALQRRHATCFADECGQWLALPGQRPMPPILSAIRTSLVFRKHQYLLRSQLAVRSRHANLYESMFCTGDALYGNCVIDSPRNRRGHTMRLGQRSKRRGPGNFPWSATRNATHCIRTP